MGSFELMAKLGLNAQPFERGLASVRSQVKDLASEKWEGFLKGFAVAGAVESIRELGSKMLELRRTAEKEGVGTTFLQTTEVLAVKFGGSAEDAIAALDKLNIKIGEAREPGSASAKAFEKFGVALNDAEGYARSTEDVFKDLADKFKELPDASARAAMAFEIFGRSGKNIAEILALGGKAIDDFGAKSNKVVSSEAVNALADAYKNVKSVVSSVGGLFMQIAGAVAFTYEKTVKIAGALSTGMGLKDAFRLSMSKESGHEKIKITADTSAADAAIKASHDAWLDALAKVSAAYEELKKQIASASQAVYNARDVMAEAEQARVVNSLPEFSDARIAEQAKLDKMMDEREMKDYDAARKAREVLDKELAVLQDKFRLENDALKKKELEIEADKKGVELAKNEELLLRLKTQHLNNHVQRENAANEVLRRRKEIEDKASTAAKNLASAKGERTKYTLEELASGNPYGVQDEKLRDEMFRAQEAMRLENRAKYGKNVLGEDEETVKGFFEQADKIKAGLTRLNEGERFPFKNLEQASKDAAKALNDLLEREGGGGLKVVPVMGK